MQFILTEQEYNKLNTLAEYGKTLPAKDKLQKLCTKIAEEMPVLWGWGDDNKPKPWGCIITSDDWYCDKCPVQEICPHDFKEWSK